MRTSILTTLIVIFALICATEAAFYLPGVLPKPYKKGEILPVSVQKLLSLKTQLPFNYYSLPFCRPKNVHRDPENLGELLVGDRIQNSLYQLPVLEKVNCAVVGEYMEDPDQVDTSKCESYSSNDIKQFRSKVAEEYLVQMIVDNLPVAHATGRNSRMDCGQLPQLNQQTGDNPDDPQYYRIGFPLGCIIENSQSNKYLINNHLTFIIRYHQVQEGTDTEGVRIVGAEVIPSSVKHAKDSKGKVTTCSKDKPLEPGKVNQQFLDKNSKDITWTYSVVWQPSEVKWTTRWDYYFYSTPDQTKIQWFSIINSLMIALFLTGMVAMIMMRTLNRDIAIYSQLENSDDSQEETGWKLVHGDVFRPPSHFSLLSMLVGSGIQVFAMSLLTLVFAILGFLSPANRGSLVTAVILLYVFFGIVSGYYSARFYKMFQGISWKRNAALTALTFPGLLFGVFFFFNFLIWVSSHSSLAIPFLDLFGLTILWFGVTIPLTLFGSYFGKKKDAIELPVRTNRIPRHIPEQPWYMKSWFSILMGGVLPFGAVFIHAFFIFSFLTTNRLYYFFTFLFVVFLILVATCAEITIVLVYFQLCSEDYHWWWRSFLTAGSSSLYLFLYALFFFYRRLEVVQMLSGLLYFGYLVMFALVFFVLTGSIGFVSAFLFVRKIYSAIKAD
eukprot:gb/GECH01011495.1/.p1 GENE.gb/GECH01011495.1/~~gb/GECH01011495.1/.p1  ORF type:complete len:667 (+),score=91.07 gb/GECH01011495.1/:1-2001(+)